jgi:TIR domain-containing protein
MSVHEGRHTFISYAHKDGKELALCLQRDLKASGFDAWLDSQRLTSDSSWTTGVESAVDGSDVVLALLTPGSYVSDICRAEQLRSLRKGKCVIPVLGQKKELSLKSSGSSPFQTSQAGFGLMKHFSKTRVAS